MELLYKYNIVYKDYTESVNTANHKYSNYLVGERRKW